MNDELMRRMRGHVGYDPKRIASGEQSANRAERRAAKRVLAEIAAKAARTATETNGEPR